MGRKKERIKKQKIMNFIIIYLKDQSNILKNIKNNFIINFLGEFYTELLKVNLNFSEINLNWILYRICYIYF